MSIKKDIAILMSTYNGERYLAEQIDSILHQTYIDRIDLYIRDDGSKDSTKEILKKYQEQYPNIKIFNEENIGCTASFFKLLKIVDGYDYYAFSDQDDVWKANKIEKAIEKIQEYEEAVLYGSRSTLVDEELNPIGLTQKCNRGITFYNALIQNLMPGHTQVFNHAFKQKINIEIDTNQLIVHDYWLALLATAFADVVFDNESYTLYRQHGNNAIGYGRGFFGWFIERLKRVKNKSAKRITLQDTYFRELYKEFLPKEYLDECNRLLDSQQSFLSRLKYIFTKKVYRQRFVETRLFEILYLVGGYKINQ